MLRTFQFRLFPNAAQRPALEHVLADYCETYNAALQERRDAWRLERKSITYRKQQDELTAVPAIRCSHGGEDVPKTLAARRHDCPRCGLSLGRDHNAALNILALGMSPAGTSPQNLHMAQVRESCI
jgi:transposase